MSFMPCYFLFNKHEYSDADEANENPCFPFLSRRIVEAGWGGVAQPLPLFKPPAHPDTPCSAVPRVESCPSSAPFCTSSLACTEEEGVGRNQSMGPQTTLSADESRMFCSAP